MCYDFRIVAGRRNGNGSSRSEILLEELIEETRKTRVELREEFRTGLEKVNERVEGLAKATTHGLARLETRLDEIARNTGTRHQEMEQRITALEKAVDDLRRSA